MNNTLELGQVWQREGSPYGDIDSYQVVFVNKLGAIVMNCATLKQTTIYGRDQMDSFTFDCKLISSNRIPADIIKRKGF